MRNSNDSSSVAVFADHEVITRPNELRRAISTEPQAEGDDPVARAEKALADLSAEFSNWMELECERLDAARKSIKTSGFTPKTKDALFHAAHDIKGEAATFGYPAVASAADSLCRLVEYTPDVTRLPVKLIDQHVDAVRAIIREYDRSDAADLARMLTQRLREVTDEFLFSENSSRPDVLGMIQAPSMIPQP
jgi:HPt (histidine-containing phosphotransfer) domain-containing protein